MSTLQQRIAELSADLPRGWQAKLARRGVLMSDFDGPTAPQRASHLANQAVIDAAASRQIAQRTANRQVMAFKVAAPTSEGEK